MIGKILAQKVNALDQIPDLYLEFARRLDLTYIVITFNYDPLLEQALEVVGKPYRLFSQRYESVSEYCGTVDNSCDEVVVLKVHGSIDWFDRTSFDRRLKLHANSKIPPPKDAIFSFEKELDLVSLVDGPRFEDDPLRSVYRAKNLSALYQEEFPFIATPRILPPSAAKIVYAVKANDFWSGIGRAGFLNGGLAIVGFSLPPQDDYARQIIYTLVTNYQRHNKFHELSGQQPATPLSIVDHFTSTEAESKFKQRYRFVDWSNTKLHSSGFNMAALDEIFA